MIGAYAGGFEIHGPFIRPGDPFVMRSSGSANLEGLSSGRSPRAAHPSMQTKTRGAQTKAIRRRHRRAGLQPRYELV